MKLMTVECSVCGGFGAGTMKAAAAQWLGAAVHSDPRICRSHLAYQREQLERDRAKLESEAAFSKFGPMDVAKEQARLDDLGRRIKETRERLGV